MSFTLPPLNALRAFESAARCGSYVAAAEELRVSPAAVSQHIRKLEDFLGKHLFTRHNNRVQLTDAGQDIFQNIHQAFGEIAAATARARGAKARTRLVISVLSSVSERWLVPQLARFAAQQAEFRFDLRAEDDPVDFARHGIDLRLSYGAAAYADLTTHLLCRDALVPLCAPSYAARAGADLSNVPEEDLIHTDWGPDFGSRPSWQDWFNAHGGGRRLAQAGNQASHSSLALELAERGLGVALGQKMLATEAIAQGRLVALTEHSIALGHAYYLVHPVAKARKPMLQALVGFLISAAQPQTPIA